MTALRPAGAADAEAVAALAAACLREAWSPAAYAAALARAETWAWIAEAGEPARSAGFLLASRVVDELHVLAVAVTPARRRRGVGRALVEAALARAAAEGVRLAHLEVRSGNAAALALYRGQRFAPVGLRRRYYGDGEDAVLLTRKVA